MVRPTACWKLEWEELETNQQHFTALCKTLKDRVSLAIGHGQHIESFDDMCETIILCLTSKWSTKS